MYGASTGETNPLADTGPRVATGIVVDVGAHIGVGSGVGLDVGGTGTDDGVGVRRDGGGSLGDLHDLCCSSFCGSSGGGSQPTSIPPAANRTNTTSSSCNHLRRLRLRCAAALNIISGPSNDAEMGNGT